MATGLFTLADNIVTSHDPDGAMESAICVSCYAISQEVA